MIKYSPCKDCNERKEGCHSKCPKYMKFKILLEQEKRKEKKEKQENAWYKVIGGMTRAEYLNKTRGRRK
jgi:hypothetical protein